MGAASGVENTVCAKGVAARPHAIDDLPGCACFSDPRPRRASIRDAQAGRKRWPGPDLENTGCNAVCKSGGAGKEPVSQRRHQHGDQTRGSLARSGRQAGHAQATGHCRLGKRRDGPYGKTVRGHLQAGPARCCGLAGVHAGEHEAAAVSAPGDGDEGRHALYAVCSVGVSQGGCT